MYPVKQSTALTVPFFVHDVSGDAVTGLADGTFTKRISKNGAGFAAMTVTISEMENGWYSIPLSTAHSNTLGILTIVFTNAGAKQVNLQFRVTAKLLDDLNDVAATDIVSAGAITTSAGAVSTVTTLTNLPSITANWLTAAGINAGALDGKGDWNIGKTGYSLTQTFPTNFADMSITATTGLMDITQTAADKVWGTGTRVLTAGTNLNDIAAGDVWAVDATSQQTQGTFGQAIGDPVADTTTIYQAVATDAAGDNVAIDVIAVKADTDDIQTRLPAALVGGRMDSNASAIAGVAASAVNLEQGAFALVRGTTAGVPTTTVIPTDLSETTVDHYKGRIVTFTSGALDGQASDITGYGATGDLTVTALTEAPGAGLTFVIS